MVAVVTLGLLGPSPGEAQAARGNRFERKANKIGRELKKRHLPHGTVFDPVFAGPDSNEINCTMSATSRTRRTSAT